MPFYPLSSHVWSTGVRSLPPPCVSILLLSKYVIYVANLITDLYPQYTTRNHCCSPLTQVRCTASDPCLTMLICHPAMYIGFLQDRLQFRE